MTQQALVRTILTSWWANTVRFCHCRVGDGPQQGPGLALGVASQDTVLQGLEPVTRPQALPAKPSPHVSQSLCLLQASSQPTPASEAEPCWAFLPKQHAL